MLNRTKFFIALVVLSIFLNCFCTTENESIDTQKLDEKEILMQEYNISGNSHHYLGIEMNIQTWNLLQKPERTDQDNVRMINFAFASQYHWYKSPNWQPVNAQRGEWLLSHVFAVLKNGEQALKHAELCWNLTEEHNFADFDLAYAYEAYARAYRVLGDDDNYTKYFKLAVDAGNKINQKEDKEIFMSDLNSGILVKK